MGLQENPFILLVDAMARGTPDGVVLAQEARGQSKLVASDLLPVEVLYADDADLEALGIQLGEVVEDDPLFRQVTLPDGWRRIPTPHLMWVDVVDEDGRKRLAVFYKAASYDRKAHVQIVKEDNDG